MAGAKAKIRWFLRCHAQSL